MCSETHSHHPVASRFGPRMNTPEDFINNGEKKINEKKIIRKEANSLVRLHFECLWLMPNLLQTMSQTTYIHKDYPPPPFFSFLLRGAQIPFLMKYLIAGIDCLDRKTKTARKVFLSLIRSNVLSWSVWVGPALFPRGGSQTQSYSLQLITWNKVHNVNWIWHTSWQKFIRC